MIGFRRVLVVVCILMGLCSLLVASWIGLKQPIRGSVPSFDKANDLYANVYQDKEVSTLLEQNLRMEEAIFEAQKEGFRSVLKSFHETREYSNRILTIVGTLIAFSLFCQVIALLLKPSFTRIHKHSLAQLEALIWESWVTESSKGMKSEYSVQESAYPVHLCGCSNSGVPVHLCGCESSAVPVHLCGCTPG